MLRGNGGQLIFFDDLDRTRFCMIMQKAAEEHQMVIHAYCFMSNHIHLILEPSTIPLSKGVHALAGSYAQYFNRRHKQRGHLFQDRFKSILIEDGEYLKRLVRYIHLNPVRANLVSLPQMYNWSSYCTYIGLKDIAWLTQSRVLKKFGTSDLEARQGIVNHTSKQTEAELDLKIVRESNQIGVFGTDEFIKEVTSFSINTELHELKFVDLIAAAQVEFQFNLEEISSESKEKRLVDIRSILALAVQKVPGIYLQELAGYLKRDSSSTCRLVKRATQSIELSSRAEKLLEKALSMKQP